jgi:hypothetical protein
MNDATITNSAICKSHGLAVLMTHVNDGEPCSDYLSSDLDTPRTPPAETPRAEWRILHDGLSRPVIETDNGRWLSLSSFFTGRWTSYPQEESDCAQIVREHNAHAQLVAALRYTRDKLNLLVAMDNCNYERETIRRSGGFDEAREAVAIADAALATIGDTQP